MARKLADESIKIVKKNSFSLFNGTMDELLEEEIHKFVKKIIGLQKENIELNIFQKWYSKWKTMKKHNV